MADTAPERLTDTGGAVTVLQCSIAYTALLTAPAIKNRPSVSPLVG